jgi:hypothetical protein
MNRFRITQGANVFDPMQEILPPARQGFGVMRTDVLQMHAAHVGGTLSAVFKAVTLGRKPPGKMCFCMKSTDFQRRLIALIGDGDGLDQHGAVGFQQTGAVAEIGFQIGRADRLDHFDGHQLVVLSVRSR